MRRRLEVPVLRDLRKKMVLIAGPRQCGKTYFSKAIQKHFESTAYYNWDITKDRKSLIGNQLDSTKELWVFDEIHKYKRWRNWLKGVYDEFQESHRILVTGSAKLDVYRRGGDSLQGRYFFHRMHPFTLSEIVGKLPSDSPGELHFRPESSADQKILGDLLQLGGFPEPFLSGSQRESERWRNQYGTRLVREDIRDLERTEDLDSMELLFDRLGSCVGSPLSINSLREDLELAHGTVAKWLRIFENVYGVFRVYPYGPPKVKAVKKEAKLYFWDWGRVSETSYRFENLVAVHLLRYCHWIEDIFGKKTELRYLRAKAGQEVDFLVLIDRKPVLGVEVKTSDESLDRGLRYFLERTEIGHAFQISLRGQRDYEVSLANKRRVRLLPAARFLAALC